MPRPSKGLTWTFRLRATDEERAAVHATVDEYAEYGITISLNDAARILIRRASRRPVDSLVVAVTELRRHRAECSRCTAEEIGCPDGARAKASADGVAALARAARPASPPAPAPEQQAPGTLMRGPFGVTVQP